MNENKSLLSLNDNCVMQIFLRQALVDFANLSNTCCRLRNVARDFSSLRLKKIDILASSDASDSVLSKREFLKVLSKIGEHVLEVKMYGGNPFIFKSVNDKCKNLKNITVFGYKEPPGLHDFQYLKQLTVGNGKCIQINEWKMLFASSPQLEVLDFYGIFEDGFMKLLSQLPKLQSLRLPLFPSYLHRSPNFHHLLRLTGLTKLSLGSDDNLNEGLIDLAKSMNLVELEIRMKFNDESLGIIKSFHNLEILSILPFGGWNEAWFENVTVLSVTLQSLKMSNVVISCSKFLEIVQHLSLLKEFDLGSLGKIFWIDKSINFPDSQAMVIVEIENALIRNRRKLNICRWDSREDSLYLYRSDHLHIINSYLVEQEARSRCLFVDSS